MSNTRLLQAAMPAERMRGAKFCSDFRDHLSMIKGGWTLFNAPTFAKNGGLVLNGTTQYATIPLTKELYCSSLTFHIEFYPTFAANEAVFRTFYSSEIGSTGHFALQHTDTGTLQCYNGVTTTTVLAAVLADYQAYWRVNERNVLSMSLASGANTMWLNGYQIKTSVTAWSAAYANLLYIGMFVTANRWFAGKFTRFYLGHHTSTLAEHQAYYNRTMWNWEDRCLVNLPLGVGQYDPTNWRTLDTSGQGNHFTLGSGGDLGYCPSQGKGKMTFDGNDWLQSVDRARPPGAFTALFCGADKSGATTSYWGTQGTSNWMLLRVASGAYRFYVGGALYAVSSAFFDQRIHTVACVYNGSIAQVYLDGIVGTPSAAVAPAGANSRIFVGSNPTPSQFLTGDMYDFKYFEGEALNPTAILDYHQKMMSRLGAEQ